MYLKLLLSVAAFVFYNACCDVIYTADFVKDFKTLGADLAEQ